MNCIDLKKLSFDKRQIQKSKKLPPPHHRPGEKFLKGPIPLHWLTRAISLPGKALHIGIILWYWAGIKKNRIICLSSYKMKGFGIKRNAKIRALKQLEFAGLIIFEGKKGCAPIVTILDGDQV